LIPDDEAQIRRVLRTTLVASGFVVREARRREETFEKHLFHFLTVRARIRLIVDMLSQMPLSMTFPCEVQRAAIGFTKGYGEFRH
jgi:DNA-binding response OmpR family regulator